MLLDARAGAPPRAPSQPQGASRPRQSPAGASAERPLAAIALLVLLDWVALGTWGWL